MPRRKASELQNRDLPTAYVRQAAAEVREQMVEYAPNQFASREVVAKFGLASRGVSADVDATD